MKTLGVFLPIALAIRLGGQTQPGAPSPGSPVEPPTLEHIGAVAPRLQPECTPPVLEWPAMEAYFDVYQWAEQNEFTVYQTMGPSSYVWGYLGARR